MATPNLAETYFKSIAPNKSRKRKTESYDSTDLPKTRKLIAKRYGHYKVPKAESSGRIRYVKGVRYRTAIHVQFEWLNAYEASPVIERKWFKIVYSNKLSKSEVNRRRTSIIKRLSDYVNYKRSGGDFVKDNSGKKVPSNLVFIRPTRIVYNDVIKKAVYNPKIHERKHRRVL